MYQAKIMWQNSPGKGTVNLLNAGQIESVRFIEGAGHTDGATFVPLDGLTTLLITVRSGNNAYGPYPTAVTINLLRNSFSFFLRDVTRSHPIHIP